MVVAQAAAPAAGQQRVTEGAVPQVLRVLGGHRGLAGVGLREHARPPRHDPSQAYGGGQVSGDDRKAPGRLIEPPSADVVPVGAPGPTARSAP